MNAIGGIYRFDGAPVSPAAIERLDGAAQLLLPGRRSSWFGESIGFACASVQADNCAASAKLVNDAGRRCVLVFDGRLDNRKEVIAQLYRWGGGHETDDASLTLAAYDAWGDDCALRLVGDFAFALWDGVRRRLLCVRDPLGVRAMYVLVRSDWVCFATQLRQVLVAQSQTPPFDLEFVADRLVHGVDRADADRTPYCGVSRLKPGHRLVAENGRVRVDRYWKWCARPETLSRPHHEHVERFRETFSEAVECRMEGAGDVWSDLSGGLDSSSIASVAARRKSTSGVRAVSVIFDDSTLSDEREWSVTAARALEVEQHCINGDAHHPFSRLREAVDYWEEPHAAAAFFHVHQAYGRLLRGTGVPVLLTGIGAEAVVMNKHQVPVYLADLLRHGRVASLLSELARWQRVFRIPFSNLIWRYCLRPAVSRPLVSYEWMPELHDWIEPTFSRKWGLVERARNGSMPTVDGGVADQWQVEAIGRITGFLLRGYLDKVCDIRYPFLHRPLVELVLATPWGAKEPPGEPKALLRRAMRGILPENIRRRSQDVSTGHAVYTGLRKEWHVLDQVVGSSLLVELGIVNRERLQYALHMARQGHAPHLGGLLSTLTLDAWLQHAARKGDTAWMTSAA
jgi:asparagine synthase (glutamine-hydrolysing)